jgi:hypothetical protein
MMQAHSIQVLAVDITLGPHRRCLRPCPATVYLNHVEPRNLVIEAAASMHWLWVPRYQIWTILQASRRDA